VGVGRRFLSSSICLLLSLERWLRRLGFVLTFIPFFIMIFAPEGILVLKFVFLRHVSPRLQGVKSWGGET